MNLAKKLLSTSGRGGSGSGEYSDDVFSTYIYTGNNAPRNIVTGQNIQASGGMVWTKARNGTYGTTDHYLFHTSRGADIFLSSNTTNGQGAFTSGTSVSSFNNDGFSLGNSPYVNDPNTNYVSWVFRNADKFYGHQVVTKNSGSNLVVNFPGLVELGMVRVKRISVAGSWYVWHRSLSAGQLLIGETSATASNLGHVTVSGTSVTLVNGVIADGVYLVEAFAHCTVLGGLVQCGSFAGNATVSIGWEPQWIMIKRTDAVGDWTVIDSMRGCSVGGIDAVLNPNLSNAESTANDRIDFTTTGFISKNLTGTYIYTVIRRPNKPPTTGTSVFTPVAYNGSTFAAQDFTTVIDSLWTQSRTNGTAGAASPLIYDRLRGWGTGLQTSSGNAELSVSGFSNPLLYFDQYQTSALINGAGSGNTKIGWNFRRAPGFMDIVCDSGTGAAHAINHGLGAVPELMIRKSRSVATQWEVWHSALSASEHLVLNSSDGKATDATTWNSTVPTATVFTVGTNTNTNRSGETYVTYLFATLPGISKVGSYTGNGSSQTIACGFTTGSRFILVKRTDSPGAWYVWDSVRGITPSNDPHLSLNTAAAEVPNDNSVGQHSSGFTVNQDPATNINVSGGSYIFLAIA